MISPDAANLGTKAAYIFAALVVPVTLIVYFFYPEVSCLRGSSTRVLTVDHRPDLCRAGRALQDGDPSKEVQEYSDEHRVERAQVEGDHHARDCSLR
jgi:hypothetical protein